MTYVVVALVAAAWGIYALRWWRDRSGKPPLFARSDGKPRARPRTSMACGVLFVAVGLVNLAPVGTFHWWSAIAGIAFLVSAVGFFVQAWRLRSPELDTPSP